jgi:hypothetical protein
MIARSQRSSVSDFRREARHTATAADRCSTSMPSRVLVFEPTASDRTELRRRGAASRVAVVKSVFLDGLYAPRARATRANSALRSMRTTTVIRDTLSRSRAKHETKRPCGDGG